MPDPVYSINEGLSAAAQLPTIETLEQIATTPGLQEVSPPVQIAIFMAALAMLSTLLVCMTSFTRIVIVFSFVRRALTTQEIPPTPVLIGLALFMTWFIMGPTVDRISSEVVPEYTSGRMDRMTAITESSAILKDFMLKQTRKDDLLLFLKMSKSELPKTPQDTKMRVLVPAFVISELKTAFMMGFCIYIPFVLIDLVISTVLMSLGMMMMPPVVMSLPFKVLLFVLVDGWSLVAQALSVSFA